MNTFTRRLEQIWYDGKRAPFFLRAWVPVYALLRTLHLLPYRYGWRKPTRLPVPVIVVGNLTAGGTGKTPLVIALVEALRARGFRPGVVSRGYGGTERKPLLLDDMPDPVRVGDEPTLIRRRIAVPVSVGRNRAKAARLLLQKNVNVIIADDGLQNPALSRDIEICVIDGERRFGNGRLLPAGPLREPLSRLATMAFRVCNGGEMQAGEFPMQLSGDMAVAIAKTPTARPLSTFTNQTVHAIAGIGHPERFFDSLRQYGIEVIAHPFSDHHPFAVTDITFNDELPILMTEKDAVKCVRFADTKYWCVPVRAELPSTFFDAVISKLG